MKLRVGRCRNADGERQIFCERLPQGGAQSTDLTLKPGQILETFALRWPLEVRFRDVKQFPGFEDPQNRVSKATQRTAPLIFYIYDLGAAVARAVRASPRATICASKALVQTQEHYLLRRHSSKSTPSHLARKDFRRPRTRCAHARNPSTPCRLGQSCRLNVQNARLSRTTFMTLILSAGLLSAIGTIIFVVLPEPEPPITPPCGLFAAGW